MKKKEFKAESKKLLDLMVNSIYTNKEIFLRELISNASDALDKLYYQSLTDTKIDRKKEDFAIWLEIDDKNRTLTVSDNGIGMTEEELENNLGTIAKSGSFDFKTEKEKKEEIDIIGQFGVGFYSAFMVSDKVEVISKAYGQTKAYKWVSEGADGYTITPCEKKDFGTDIILHIKKDDEDESYKEYLDSYKIQRMVKKYSDYIKYPIKMNVEHEHLKEGTKEEYETVTETEILNSMVPIWKKNKKEVTEEAYDDFYKSKFFDYEKPLKTISTYVEGMSTYHALLYIPSHAPYDFYSKEYEKGLELYSNGVLIMEKCSDLLPDYFAFVKGIVDSSDLSLNISREMLQKDRQLKNIAKNIEKKIKNELENMLEKDREKYEEFFKNFGMSLKFGAYNDFGLHKDELKDLLLFYSSKEKKLVTFKEYLSRMKEGQENIYYASGESIDKIDLLPQVENVKDKDYEVLYLTDYVDEFVLQVLMDYDGKKFLNVCDKDFDLDTKEEKEELEKTNKKYKDMFTLMKEDLKGEVEDVRFTHRLKNHPVCLTTEGEISNQMAKVMNAMPIDQKVSSKKIMEINEKHPIGEKLKTLYKKDKDAFKQYTEVLYAQARLIEGLSIENPTEISNIICDLLAK